MFDAGPIIKLFELGIWDEFIEKCDVTVSQIVANQANRASLEFEDIRIDIKPYEEQGLIKIIDVEPSAVEAFYKKFSLLHRYDIHDGEKETLVFLQNSPGPWQICAADKAVFKVLGFLGKVYQGISLEELLKKIGLWKDNLEWEYTRKFREKYTRMGQIDSIQD